MTSLEIYGIAIEAHFIMEIMKYLLSVNMEKSIVARLA